MAWARRRRLVVRIVRALAARALTAVPRPASPAAEPWELSIAAMVRAVPLVPSIVGWLFRRFDKVGRVVIGPDRVGFDAKTVRWRRVIEVRAYPCRGLVPAVVVDHEVERIRELLPPIPGRKWMVARAAHFLLFAAGFVVRPPRRGQVALPCEIVYRSRLGRPVTLAAGLFAAITLQAIPEASHSLVATAQARAVPVRAMPDRARSVRATFRAGPARPSYTHIQAYP